MPTGEGGFPRKTKTSDANQNQAGQRDRFAKTPGIVQQRFGHEGQERTREQFERSRMQKVKRQARMRLRQKEARQKAGCRKEGHERDETIDRTLHHCEPEHQQRGKKQIELFFDRQRPRMQKRSGFSGGGEVIEVFPEKDIRRKSAEPSGGSGGYYERGRGQKGDGKKQRADGCGQQSGQNTSGATLPEVRQSKASFTQIAKDQMRNQKPRDDKENVDADESAGHAEVRMEQHHARHGNGAKAVDIGSVGKRRFGLQGGARR